VAACDPDPKRRELMAGEYGCATYSKIEDLIADPAVELVDVATRSPEHTAHAIMALKAGKKVFLEKPIALSLPEAKKLGKVAAKYPGAFRQTVSGGNRMRMPPERPLAPRTAPRS
jgi:predicted dehydrogenase